LGRTMPKKTQKIRLGIFDFTDCEGCQVKLVSLRERLPALLARVDIVNWRLGQDKGLMDSFDVVLIEGSPVTKAEVDLLKVLRKRSACLIGFGTCATMGGIPAIMDKKERAKWYRIIYGPGYKPRGIDALPLTSYVQMDFLVHGCPVDENEIVRLMEELLSGKSPSYRGYSVCFSCKLAGKTCRLINGKPCLGPITQGGCGAVCIKGGSPCYACFGIRDAAQIEALLTILKGMTGNEEIKGYFSMFLRYTKEYKEIVRPFLER
jgi:sulfhydrogenase subunit delta